MMQQYGSIRADRLVIDDNAFVAVNDLIRCYKSDARYRKVTVPWQADCPSKTIRCLSLAANALLMGVNNSVTARDRKTGDLLWQQDDLDGHVLSWRSSINNCLWQQIQAVCIASRQTDG